jgi:hypothetical protein
LIVGSSSLDVTVLLRGATNRRTDESRERVKDMLAWVYDVIDSILPMQLSHFVHGALQAAEF